MFDNSSIKGLEWFYRIKNVKINYIGVFMHTNKKTKKQSSSKQGKI